MAHRDRKKIQKKITNYQRTINKNIAADPLWRGRFVLHSVRTYYERFTDGSGGELYSMFEVIDKKTGTKSTPKWISNFSSPHGMCRFMNWAITEYFDVWAKEGRDILYSDTTDYTKIEVTGNEQCTLLVE